tara:strand:+ start:8938 stop:9231 length:294 start_codon:yes stop_codon:yes gene_type:complete
VDGDKTQQRDVLGKLGSLFFFNLIYFFSVFKKKINTMNDIYSISFAVILAISFELLVKEHYISFVNVILFINIFGLYYITKNIKCVIKVSYNDRDDD